MKAFLKWVNSRHLVSVRALMVYTVLHVFVASFYWASQFADKSLKSGSEIAMIIASVTAPLALVLPIVFNIYMKAKKETPQNESE